jgi:hypothetical protein
MKDSMITELGDAIASVLVSHAAHGLGTSSLDGTGEISLRDGLIVAAAAVAAKARQAWILAREQVPEGWTDAPVDLMIHRVGNNSTIALVGGVELKWWRKADAANAANRRRDLLRDFIRAATLYQQAESFAFVTLLSTSDAWNATANTQGKDKDAMAKLSSPGSQSWNLEKMATSKGLRAAMRSLDGHVRVSKIFHTELLATREISNEIGPLAFAKVWKVKKPQSSVFLTSADLSNLLTP